MTVFPPTAVLVHGAWHDERCWAAVVAHLSQQRMPVVTLTLPSTDPGRELPGFADDVAALVDVIDAIPGPVTLCGHGYGGMVISEAGNHDRVRRLVYLAAACPRPGERAMDQAGRLRRSIRMTGDGRMLLSARTAAHRLYGDLGRSRARHRAESLLPSTAAIFQARSIDPAWRSKPTTYVVCGRDRALDRAMCRRRADEVMVNQLAHGRGDGFAVTLPTGHAPFYSAPRAVAEIVAGTRRIGAYPLA
ncbi:MAG: alpha/beta hydrolase [Actinomycetota bacterium]